MGRDWPYRIRCIGKVDQESVIYYNTAKKCMQRLLHTFFYFPTISLEILSRHNKEKRF